MSLEVGRITIVFLLDDDGQETTEKTIETDDVSTGRVVGDLLRLAHQFMHDADDIDKGETE